MIKKIFFNDLKNLSRSFFAMVIVIGVCVLPALYAWLNIYSNKDPYGNTGGLKVAVFSMDEGYKDEDGKVTNTGDEIIKQLKGNDAIDWQFSSGEDEALEGVKSGMYYAALIIPKDFSYNMFNIFTEDVERPTLVFYQNLKKNAVANKITDTVVGNLQASLNEKFISVITKEVFNGINDLSDKVGDEKEVDSFIGKIRKIRTDIDGFVAMIEAIEKGGKTLSKAIILAEDDTKELKKKVKKSAKDVSAAASDVGSSQKALSEYSELMKNTMDSVDTLMQNIKLSLEEAKVTGDLKQIETAAGSTAKDVNSLKTDIEALAEAAASDVTGIDEAALEESSAAMGKSLNSIDNILDKLQNIEGGSEALDKERLKALESVDEALIELERVDSQFTNKFVPQLNKSIDAVEQVLLDASDVMEKMGDALGGMNRVYSALEGTTDAADKSLKQTEKALTLIAERLDTLLEKLDSAKSDEKWTILAETFSGSPEIYADFFAEPVEIETSAIYPVENYGSAVTPFYTVLAIWVGALILTAILKTHPSPKRYPGAKDYQLFFGRFLIFAVLGQIQAAVTVWGDLVIFKVQCKEPFYFWFAAAVTSLTFAILIYSLVASFGDVGKALAVVIVVLQIAGSSGTFPIELLPGFFQNVYIFFPFPYAINAMRECVGGMYGKDYWIYLLQLSVFIIVALAIGIWVRRPFANLNHYMEQRMEDTEMM